MFIRESEMFKELAPAIVNEIAQVMVEESHDPGETLFTDKDDATCFYILVDGRVRLAIGEDEKIDYTVSKEGEVFGWSGMLDRQKYTATAECVAPTKLLRIDTEALNEILEKDPKSGAMFFRRVAGAIFQRLVDNYQAYLASGRLSGVASYGASRMTQAFEE
jgi:CRP-like cAMP-binding protein